MSNLLIFLDVETLVLMNFVLKNGTRRNRKTQNKMVICEMTCDWILFDSNLELRQMIIKNRCRDEISRVLLDERMDYFSLLSF